MARYKYSVFIHGEYVGEGIISLTKGSQEARIGALISRKWGRKSHGFTWTIQEIK